MESPWAYKQMRSQPRLPFPGQRHSNIYDETSSSPNLVTKPMVFSGLSTKEITGRISNFALQNPQDFEDYIIENTRLETISRWFTKKKSLVHNQGKLEKDSMLKLDSDDKTTDNEVVCDKEYEKLKTQIETGHYIKPLYEFCSQLQTMTMSSGFSFYTSDGGGDSLHLYNPGLPHWKINPLPRNRIDTIRSYPVGVKTTVAAHVAYTMQPIIVDDLPMDERFPKGVATSGAISVMCLPFTLPNGDLLGVIELYRCWDSATYTPETLTISQNFLDWVMLAVHKTEVSNGLQQQSEMSEFLLKVSRTYLDDITDIDSIVRHIMRFAKSLVSAERCSLFLLDKETGELYSNLFDAGEEENGETVFIKQAEIRFPLSKGIAGSAAMTKTVLNIADAYADKRFNREVDKLTGFTTRSVLCIPIMGEDEVYGVVEMINKKDGGAFTKTDQNNFHMFAVFCALALRYSKVHAKLLKDQCRFEVVQEQYLYHSNYAESDYKALLLQSQDSKFVEGLIPPDFDRFHFSVIPFQNELLLFFIKMVQDVVETDDGGISVPLDVISRFVLAVRCNYRKLPYHNWYHAMTVCHGMYCIVKRHFDIFDKIERFALLVACLCHDIDHRSLSNQFLRKVNHPLAVLYPSSTMEYHHLQLTLNIMSRENHNIYGSLNAADQAKALAITQQAIIATDLALYFANRSYIDDLLTKGIFTFSNPEHRTGAMDLMMSSCDISSTTKEWKETSSNVRELYQEFWAEGDKRKKLNIPLIPMMDRDLEEDLPDGQVSFYSIVVVKCFETLAKMLPKCEPMELGAKLNLERWREEVDVLKSTKESRTRKGIEEKKRERKMEEENVNLRIKGGLWMVEESRTKF